VVATGRSAGMPKNLRKFAVAFALTFLVLLAGSSAALALSGGTPLPSQNARLDRHKPKPTTTTPTSTTTTRTTTTTPTTTTTTTTTTTPPAPTVSAPVATAAPLLSGAAAVGQKMAVSTGTWSGNPTSFAYQWNRCSSVSSCAPLAGATGSSYSLVSSDAGSTLRATVAASSTAGSGSATSAATALVVRPSPDNTVIKAGSGGSITGADGSVWTIVATNGGQVAVNGATDAITGNVALLAYEAGRVYQQNTVGNWYYKVHSGDTWVGPTTTSPIPGAAPPVPAGGTELAPIGGYSPGGNFSRNHLDGAIMTWEENEMLANASGHKIIVRVDYEDVIQEVLDKGWDAWLIYGGTIRNIGSLPGGSISAYGTGAAALVNRWKNVRGPNNARLRLIEVGGNEPNIGGRFTPAQETQILADATPKIKAVDPTIIVSNGGLAPAADNGTDVDPRTWVAGMISAGLNASMLDEFSIHIYGDAAVREPWSTWVKTWNYGVIPVGTSIRERLSAAGMNAVRINSGESGDSSDDTALNTTVKNGFAEFKRRRLLGEPIGTYSVFSMRQDWAVTGSDNSFGMTRLDRTRKPSWYAAQTGIAAG
jgi:hypothetical protein